MNTLLTIDSPMSKTSEQSPTAPISAAEVNDLWAARILISGTRLSDLAFLQTMLSLSGFTNITIANGSENLMKVLRHTNTD